MQIKLLPRMMLFFLLPAVLGLVVITAWNYIVAKDALTSQIDEEIKIIANDQAGEFTNTIGMLGSTVETLAENNAITNLLITIEKYPDFNPNVTSTELQPLLRTAQTTVESIAQNFSIISGVGIVSKKGIVLAHTTKTFIGTNLLDRQYIQNSLQGKTGFQNIKSRATNALSTTISYPVMISNQIIGVAYITLDLSALSIDTVNSIKISKTGRGCVYSTSGTVLMHLDNSQIGQDHSSFPWVKNIVNTKDGLLNYTFENVDTRSAYTLVPLTDWIVVVSIDEHDVQAPVNKMLTLSLVLCVVIFIIVGAIIYIVARGITLRLQDGAKLVKLVANGHFKLTKDEQIMIDQEASGVDAIANMANGIKIMIQNLNTLFDDAQNKTMAAEAATEQAHQATQLAEQAQKQAESAKQEGMLAAAQQLEQVVAKILKSSKMLNDIITRSEEGTKLQSVRISETAVAMEEMNSTVMEVAKSAGEASTLTATTKEKAHVGSTLVKDSITSIQKLEADSLTLKQDMTALGQNAQDITQIMSVISDIADQTNLLALNAAIEAARAGDAGRGFAVVADEVRKLAEKTMASTTDVANAIRAIQNSSDKSIIQVEMAVNNIELTTKQSLTSGTALQEIVNMMEITADQVRAIATASDQQSATSEEINHSISQIDSIAQETAQAMRSAKIAVNDVSEQVVILTGLIDQLKQG